MRRFILLSLFLFCLAGCSLPVTTSPASLPSPSPQTVSQGLDATPAVAYPPLRIKNAATGQYLYQDHDLAGLTYLTISDSSIWLVETYRGEFRLRNLASGDYLSIQTLRDQAEVTPIQPDWLSPRWNLEGDPAGGSVAIRSIWRPWQVLYVSDGQVRYDRVDTADQSARWILAPANGQALPAATALPAVNLPAASNPPGSRGAWVPWLEYEAEDGQTNAQVLPPDRSFGSIASESSGRSALRLAHTGDYAQFTTKAAANSIVIRYVIPDSADGQGLNSTISLYVDGKFRQKIALTSRYAWSYGGEKQTLNTPSAGGAHHFYDEARALVGEIPAGSNLRLQKDAADSANYVVLDLVDLEEVPPPLSKPDGYISIEACGAVPNSGQDAGDAIQQCINQARGGGTGVWIPPGTFESNQHGWDVFDVTIQGAGMWYSSLHGPFARFNCIANNCRYADFSILGETLARTDSATDNGFTGSGGTGSSLKDIWVEHTRSGFWVSGETDGLLISDSRFRDLYADGVNFCNGTSNSVIQNSHFRNTGDDALSSWSPQGDPPNQGNIFRYNTIQIPWRANCIGVYGGMDTRVEDNLCSDVVTYSGILIAQQFNSNPFRGGTFVSRNSIIRGGGPPNEPGHGALKVWAQQGPVSGLQVRNLLVDSPTFAGLELQGGFPITEASFDQLEIDNAGTYGLFLAPNLQGDASFSNLTISQSRVQNVLNQAPPLKFSLTLGPGISGWPTP